LFFAHYLSTGAADEAMALAGSSIFGVLSRTAEAGASELLLVEAQQEFVTPSQVFPVHRI
jgi:pyridoxine kinase